MTKDSEECLEIHQGRGTPKYIVMLGAMKTRMV